MSFSSPLITFFNQYPKALLITHADGSLFLVNLAFTQLTGFDSGNLVTSKLTELYSHSSTESTSKSRCETILTKQDGSKIPVKILVSDCAISAESSVKVYTFDNNSVLKEYEEKNAKQAKKLEQLTEELERFTYVTSHDLQAPLRMIGSYIQLIQKSIDKGEGERAREFMGFVQDGISNLHALIDGLLQFSRINKRGSSISSVDTNESVRAAIAQLSEKMQKAGAKVTFDKLPVVTGDLSQLKQLFQNLIDNALKFRAPDKQLLVSISVTETENDYQFSVKDNGIGIDPKYFDRIFLIFQRLHNRSEYEGTGTGLAVSKKIVENHEGKIWVESEPGLGSTFFFTIKK